MFKNFFQFNREAQTPQSGYVIIFAIVFLAIFMSLSAALVGYTALNIKGSKQDYYKTQALYLAEAGVVKALNELNINSNYTGATNLTLGPGTYSVTITTLSASRKKITAIGSVPDSFNPKATRTLNVVANINTSSVAFNYGVQVGAGGLVMDNNSKINGNVFSNGSITGGKGTTTGDVIVAVGTQVNADEEWTVQNQDFVFGTSTPRRDVAQSFKPNTTNPLNKIQVYIKKVGAPGDLTVRIVSDDNGSPSDNELGSTNINASLVTVNYGWVEAVFASPITLSSGGTYWLMLSAPSIHATKYYIWGQDTNNGYGNGVGKYSTNWNANPPVWINASGDFNYKIFMGGVTTYVDSDIKFGGNLTATEIRDCGKVVLAAYYDSVFSNCPADGGSVGSGPIPGPQAMPVSESQIEDWKTTAQDGGVLSGPYIINGTENLGPIKIDGDLTVNGGAVLNMTGPVWVKGDITFNNNAWLTLDPSLGNAGTILLADDSDNQVTKGVVTVSNNTIILGNGNPNSYPMILTTNSSLSGAMYVNNNAAGTIFYASAGSIEVSNNAGSNQITGYKIHLNENSVINYQSGLQNAAFTNGPGASWKLESGSYIISP